MSTYTIGEMADRSGFSASALRYYEGIGLVVPTTRTAAGYRLYDDDHLGRLAFIARAKQLGCSLEEIADLVAIWDGERCGPVQMRFHALVTEKLAAAERQIAELTALTEQLQHAAAQLAGPAVDGACSAACACLTVEAALGDVNPIPIYDATVPVACTAGPDEITQRIEQVERMRSHLESIERTEDGLLLRFPSRPAIDDEVRGFTVDEQACCPFWGFEVSATEDRLTLRWDAPPHLRDHMDRLYDFFDGDEPLTDASGLL